MNINYLILLAFGCLSLSAMDVEYLTIAPTIQSFSEDLSRLSNELALLEYNGRVTHFDPKNNCRYVIDVYKKMIIQDSLQYRPLIIDCSFVPHSLAVNNRRTLLVIGGYDCRFHAQVGAVYSFITKCMLGLRHFQTINGGRLGFSDDKTICSISDRLVKKWCVPEEHAVHFSTKTVVK